MSDLTIDKVHDEILDAIDDSYQKSIGFPTYDLTRGIAIGIYNALSRTEQALKEIDVNNMSGEKLRTFVAQRRNIQWHDAVKASGILKATTSGPAIIPKGHLFETESGLQYVSTNEVQIDGLSGDIPIEAVVSGTDGNIGAGYVTVIPVTVANLISVINTEPVTGGYRAETDSELRERYFEDLKLPISSANKAQYKIWALEVAGVGEAKVFPLANGANTVEVCIIGNDGMPATTDLISRTQNYIDPDSSGEGYGKAPIGAHCAVTTANKKLINVAASVTLSDGYEIENVQRAVVENLTEYLASLAFKTNIVSYAHMANVLHETTGVSDYSELKINGGISSVSLQEKEVATIGTVTINDRVYT